VERVGKCPGSPTSDPPDVGLKGTAILTPSRRGVGYFSMEVRKLTIFGLAYGKVSVDCDHPR
jgi:hypothetical protein